jgi:glutamate dehydrogenase
VVAADKGTATFSDIANAISAEYGFWLGDAFASGGSAGYDHKKMAITARGAWECVKRHFRELGVDIQREPFTVAGIGDMSGDVFGNGMLLSPHIRLVAAFNHQHIFIDPHPDAARSFRERERLFKLPRSGWNDYDAAAVARRRHLRAQRQERDLSREAQRSCWAWSSERHAATRSSAPSQMRVDLLWNGGIGTYVKASGESHGEIGDRANDAVRIDGARGARPGHRRRRQPRLLAARPHRIRAAGGRINTDFIDNSAGVNTSDVEVNLKILLARQAPVVRRPGRGAVALLASVTDEVAALVLRNNYLQSQAISLIEQRASRTSASTSSCCAARARRRDQSRAGIPAQRFRHRRAHGARARPDATGTRGAARLRQDRAQSCADRGRHRRRSLPGRELERYFPQRWRAASRRRIKRHRLRSEIIIDRDHQQHRQPPGCADCGWPSRSSTTARRRPRNTRRCSRRAITSSS